jgi:hypothetical protein
MKREAMAAGRKGVDKAVLHNMAKNIVSSRCRG